MKNRKNSIREGSCIADIAIYLFLVILSVIFIYPLYEVIVCSVSDVNAVVIHNSFLMWPVGFHLEAYKMVLSNKNIWIGFRNTMLYMALGTTFQYIVTVFTAYPLSIRDLWGKKAILIIFTVTMYFSGGLIPYFLLINSLGMYNSIWVLIIPLGVNVYNMIIMRTQFLNLPAELKEAAEIDGAGDITMLFKILIPLSGAVSAVLVLFTAVSYWNMWFDPMIFLTERKLYPIQSVLREILIDDSSVQAAGAGAMNSKLLHNVDTAAVQKLIKYANIVVTTVPILCIYPFAQKYFVKGVMVGSLKG